MIPKNSGHIKWICRIRILYHSSNTRDYVAKESSGRVVMPVGAQLQLSRCSQVVRRSRLILFCPITSLNLRLQIAKVQFKTLHPS